MFLFYLDILELQLQIYLNNNDLYKKLKIATDRTSVATIDFISSLCLRSEK